MGKVKGQVEYQKFKDGKPLSPKQAIKAQCFSCNGEEEGSSEDCKGVSCPLYPKWSLKGRSSIVAAVVALFIIAQFIVVGICHADRVYVEDRGVIIPIDTNTGDVECVSNANGTQTWVYDHGYQTDIVHPDGTTTSVFGDGD